MAPTRAGKFDRGGHAPHRRLAGEQGRLRLTPRTRCLQPNLHRASPACSTGSIGRTPTSAGISPSTRATCPPTRTASGTCPRAAPSGSGSPIPTRAGATARQSARGAVAVWWRFAGADARRARTKWRCPTGECSSSSRWVRADRLHPLVPRESKRWKSLYRGRAAVEREFGRLKNEWALLPLRVRGIERVRLHADLTILAKLACALSRARSAPLAA